MKVLKYLLLGLIVWNLPTFYSYDISIGSKLSSLTFGLLIVYYVLNKKSTPNYPFLIIGILYFIISGLISVGSLRYFLAEFTRYILFIICGSTLVKNTKNEELFVFFILGSTSIIVHALIFQSDFGRYSGFYIDPNAAGFICLIGYCISFSIKSIPIRALGQLVVTFSGILTFSRTFLLLWLAISFISVLANKKNAVNFGIGAFVIFTLVSLSTILELNNVRFNMLKHLFENSNSNITIHIRGEEPRWEIWSRHYETILNSPIIGNGYKAISGFFDNKVGVHNSFLMILGESGILTFLVFCYTYFSMVKMSFSHFKEETYLFMLSISLIGLLMTIHNYFENYPILFTSMWLYTKNMELNSSNLKDILIHRKNKTLTYLRRE